jgi:hypothetical protein
MDSLSAGRIENVNICFAHPHYLLLADKIAASHAYHYPTDKQK